MAADSGLAEVSHSTVRANTAVQQRDGIGGDNVALRHTIVAGNSSSAAMNIRRGNAGFFRLGQP